MNVCEGMDKSSTLNDGEMRVAAENFYPTINLLGGKRLSSTFPPTVAMAGGATWPFRLEQVSAALKHIETASDLALESPCRCAHRSLPSSMSTTLTSNIFMTPGER
jgi:hypothetical protein